MSTSSKRSLASGKLTNERQAWPGTLFGTQDSANEKMRLETDYESIGSGSPAVPAAGASAARPPLAKGMCTSHWLQSVRSSPLLDHRSTPNLPASAEVVIIGSGISGALVAMSLLDSPTAPTSIVMLEARETCSGATGRNAGHCKPDLWRGFVDYEPKHGAERTLEILRNEFETWTALRRYVVDNKVDCDLWVGKTLDVMMTEEAYDQAEDAMRRFVEAGGDRSAITSVLEASEAERVSRLKGAKAVYAWDASTLHPWKLVAHIIQRCLGRGMNLQTWTPVTGVTGTANDWTVHTDRGDIRSPTVVHATNAYAAYLLPQLSPVIRPAPHMCNRVIPPASHSGSKTLRNSYMVFYDDHYFTINPRSTSDGAILFGGSPTGTKQLYEHIERHPELATDDSLIDYEPILKSVRRLGSEGFQWDDSPGAQVRYDYSWSGITGYTPDDVPLVGAVPGKEGQWMSCAHNGHGMARTFTCSPALVKLMQGAKWEQVNLPKAFEVTPERLSRLSKGKGTL